MAEADERGPGGLGAGLVRATGAVLGFHVRIAQREAANDMGRVVGGVFLALFAALAFACALVCAHVAAMVGLATQTSLGWLRAAGLVGCVDLLFTIALATAARAQLRRPVLRETRSLLRETLASFVGSSS